MKIEFLNSIKGEEYELFYNRIKFINDKNEIRFYTSDEYYYLNKSAKNIVDYLMYVNDVDLDQIKKSEPEGFSQLIEEKILVLKGE